MTKDEALRMALEALDLAQALLEKSSHHKRILATYTAIKEVLAQPEQEPLTEWLVCPKCSYKSPYTPIKAKTLAEDAERITKQTRAALAQPEQEPVAWVKYARKKPEVKALSWQEYPTASEIAQGFVSEPLYRNPPKREWVGLTDAEWSDLYEAHHDKYNLPKQGSPDGMDYERAIADKLKERNHD